MSFNSPLISQHCGNRSTEIPIDDLCCSWSIRAFTPESDELRYLDYWDRFPIPIDMRDRHGLWIT